MSHVAQLDIKCTNVEAMKAACTRAGALFLGKGLERFYDESEYGGYLIQLPGWEYNLVIQADGSLAYDNYEGQWGDIAQLNQFKQLYAIEAAKQAAQQNQYYFQEEQLPTGVLKLTIEV